jgi:hypothetical protein
MKDGRLVVFRAALAAKKGVRGLATRLNWTKSLAALALLASAALLSGGCAKVVVTSSAAPIGAASPDAGSPDAGSPDAGTSNAGVDAGIPADAGTPVDAGPADDAGVADAGFPDAGDAGLALNSLRVSPHQASAVAGQPFQFRAAEVFADGGTRDVTAVATWTISGAGGSVDAGATVGTSVGSLVVTAAVDGAADSAALLITTRRIAFVSSSSGIARFGDWSDARGQQGTAAADAICGALASRAGLAGAFRAWISDSRDDAYCRVLGLGGKRANQCGGGPLPPGGPWISTLGEPFGESLDAVLAGAIDAPIRGDERGADVGPGAPLRTGTGFQGGLDSFEPASTCSDWTAASDTEQSVGSESGYTAGFWTESLNASCASAGRLYCFEIGDGAGPALPATPAGKLAFVTSDVGGGDLGAWSGAGGATGIAAGDNICRNAAARAGLANAATFKAWLSDSSVDAIDRLSWPGPWVRGDGALIAPDKTVLTSGELSGSISMNERGEYVLFTAGKFDEIAWTGTTAAGRKDANRCTDWTDQSGAVHGAGGVDDAASPSWSDNAYFPCVGPPLALYCFADQ